MDQQLFTDIKQLGLQENEAYVYLSLLELGSGTVTDISKRAGLNRTTGYAILEKLGLYGIVNCKVVSERKRVYFPEPPIRLKTFLENKKRTAEQRLQEIDNILPKLKDLYKTELKPIIKIAEGVPAMKEMAVHELEAKSDIYSIANIKNYVESFSDMGKERTKGREKYKIKEKCLCIKSPEAEKWYKENYSNKKSDLTEYRWLPENDKYATAGEIVIYDDTVIAILSKESENISFEIKSQTYADFLKMVFEKAWETAEKQS